MNKEKKKPLLYIHQPQLKEVRNNMQEVFRTKRILEEKEQELIQQPIEEKQKNSKPLHESMPLGQLNRGITSRKPHKDLTVNTPNSAEAPDKKESHDYSKGRGKAFY